MELLSVNRLTRAALHHAVPLPREHRPKPRRTKPGRVSKLFTGMMRMVGAAPPASVDISLSTVSLASSFDAYLYAGFAGSPAGMNVSLILDSGNTVLVVPRWEDIAAIPNWQAQYTILGQATEPWGCPANVVQGPIQLLTDTGEPFVIEACVFLACTADSAAGGGRTANFGAGCIEPWTASGWNTPAGIPVTLKSPLAYATGTPFAEFDYATADEVFNAANPQGVSEKSTLRLYGAAPNGYQFLQVVANCPWMALRPKLLKIASTATGWPAPGANAIAMVDSGGTSVYLSDPTGLVYGTIWPPAAANPPWTSGSVNCVSTSANLQISLGDDRGASFTYTIDEAALPASAQGLTLVMCQVNEFMRGQPGMNIGGLSVLAVQLMVDYSAARVGFRALGS
ncbi:hypothetical protein SAMN05421770_10746 [Granulicella rosea]|uniref:Peptidase A1 domain-containing protein n=1 Tax=Granulicella rosea TaxID=474952 RepID=A0A239LKA4_9BACT|nr:hypothetical protein [Granulicella rosea]SNT30089.1 hypothetical protein SAMN05421770_10746 [Granulicella rosea]